MLWAILLALALPNPAHTPGLTRGLSTKTICSTRWGRDARHVTEKMKRDVAASYGLKRSQVVSRKRGRCCEFDHLISRELGGADDVRNLWPQPWADAIKKDVLENHLHVLVCRGELSLTEAQHAIATNWVAAAERYKK